MENSTSTDISQNTPTYDTTASLGQRFRQAREKMGLSLEQAAEQTFILKRHLQSLEEDNFEQLPQPTFAKGFATNYGRFLGLDSNMVAQSFDAQYPEHLKQKHTTIQYAPQPIGTLQRDGRSNIKVNPLMVAMIIGALGLIFYLFSTVKKAHTENNQPTVASTASVQGITNTEQATGADLNNAGSAIPTTTVPASGLPATGSAITGVAIGTASTPTASSTVMPPASTATAGASTIELWVHKPTTLTITDADGQVLLSGEQPRGGKNLTGKPPIKVSIDNTSTVNLDYNKQPIKLSDYAQNGKANFTLN